MIRSQIKYIETANLSKLTRAHFFEILVRIAVAKYVFTEIEKDPKQATKRLIEEELLKRVSVESPDQMRKELIQTRELHILFKANADGLLKVFNYF